jgi:uncharacterized protein (TIGR03790 family)
LLQRKKLSPQQCALWAILAFCAASAPGYALTPSEVLILVNSDVPISSDVAKMYQQSRRIPLENVLRLHLAENCHIERELYLTRIASRVKTHLEEHKDIQCIVITAGVPYVSNATPGRQDGVAVDNELAAVLREAPKDWNGWQPNPLFVRGQNPFWALNPRYVARLDGPNLKC